MTSEEALERELETPIAYIERNGVYYQVPVWVKKDLEVLEILRNNKDLLVHLIKKELFETFTFNIEDENKTYIWEKN